MVLAICAGGLRNYLLEKNELPEKPLVAMAPISVRQEIEEKGNDDDTGNQVSAMLLSLATDISDPLERLLHIHSNTRRSKVHASALPANQLTEFLPSETPGNSSAGLYTHTPGRASPAIFQCDHHQCSRATGAALYRGSQDPHCLRHGTYTRRTGAYPGGFEVTRAVFPLAPVPVNKSCRTRSS